MSHINTRPVVLYKGQHDPGDCADGKRCLFEWYNWLTRQQNTDTCPPGVSPVLHGFGMRLNDILPDAPRQELKFALPNGMSPLAGTAGDGLDHARSFMALDWLARTWCPAWLDLAGLSEEAVALRDLRRLTDLATMQSAVPALQQASQKADAAWAAARDAARDALATTVTQLQGSAIALYKAMISPAGDARAAAEGGAS